MEGKAKGEGKLAGTEAVSIEQIKADYSSLAKKTFKSSNFLKENLFSMQEKKEEPKQKPTQQPKPKRI